MKVQPRQQLLEVLRAAARVSFQDGNWVKAGRDRSNSISDAEQLLCILYPAVELPSFGLAKPDETAEDVLNALQVLGGSIEIPKLLVKVLTEYMVQYTNDAGLPIFPGGAYFQTSERGAAPGSHQEELEVVDSFSISITLTLASLGFVRIFRNEVTREELRQEIENLERLASDRLTAAMVGLLRSFSVHVFEVHSEPGQILCRRSNQNGLPQRQVVRELQNKLQKIKSGLRDLTIGSGQTVDIDSSGRLFECGWSWGIVKGAEHVKLAENIAQPDGVAPNEPSLYFTVGALTALEDLFSERTRTLGILDEVQRGLSQSLQIRWDLTQRYWSTIATFGTGRWPIEDLPWQISDTSESDYYSLSVCAMVVQGLVHSRGSDSELGRVVEVLGELASRGRINRRPVREDPAFELHTPGMRLLLRGSEVVGDHQVGWLVPYFAPLLLKRIIAIAGLVRDTGLRGRLLSLADNAWEHLLDRRLDDGPGEGLWDQPCNVFDYIDTRYELQSWSYTERMVECLVAAANLVDRVPLHSTRLTEYVGDLLNEADHLFDRELLIGSGDSGPSIQATLQAARTKLSRARTILHDRPGSAAVLAGDVLRQLEELTAAREDASEGA